MSATLPIVPLTVESFSPFGDILSDDTARRKKWINQNTTIRFDGLAIPQQSGGELAISLFRPTPRPTPIKIEMLECHPLGSQAFMPASGGDWLVVVATGDAKSPDLNGIHCFLANGCQGVNYHTGVWHHPLLSLVAGQDFWVVDRAAAAGESSTANLSEYWLSEDSIKYIYP